MLDTDFDRLFGLLSTRQHLHPHEAIADALSRTIDTLGVCPIAVEQAVGWLGIDASTSIGRLRRTELTQLARSIHRFWRQATPATQES